MNTTDAKKRLAAAAPKLLEACKEALTALPWEADLDEKDDHYGVLKIVRKIKAAIDKAEKKK